MLWLLLALSLAAVAVMIDRIWFFLQERPPRDRPQTRGRVRLEQMTAAVDRVHGLASRRLAGVAGVERNIVRAQPRDAVEH